MMWTVSSSLRILKDDPGSISIVKRALRALFFVDVKRVMRFDSSYIKVYNHEVVLTVS